MAPVVKPRHGIIEPVAQPALAETLPTAGAYASGFRLGRAARPEREDVADTLRRRRCHTDRRGRDGDDRRDTQELDREEPTGMLARLIHGPRLAPVSLPPSANGTELVAWASARR